MITAIMSDAHANPSALETALVDARRQGCGKFVFLGDITGYGYDVAKAVEIIRANFDAVLLGNHDYACAGLEPSCEATNPSYQLDLIQRKHLEEGDRAWLCRLPIFYTTNSVAFAHGDFIAPSKWRYIDEEAAALQNFNARKECLMFCGHSHHAQIWQLPAGGRISSLHDRELSVPAMSPESIVVRLETDARYIVNVGSVGYPRHDFCSVYGIYDSTNQTLTIRRLPFDFKTYVSSMLANKIELPDWLCALLMQARGRQ